MNTRQIQFIFSLIALIYVTSISFLPYSGAPLLKSVPAWILTAAIAIYDKGSCKNWVALAFLFCGFGDFILATNFESSFLAGLMSFSVAHCFFALCFYKFNDFKKIAKWKLAVIILVIVSSLIIATVILPHTQNLFWPVIFYMLVIVLMAIAAVGVRQAPWPLILGAASFMVSDTLLAVDTFYLELPLAHYGVMMTYYTALLMLYTGWLQLRIQPENSAP